MTLTWWWRRGGRRVSSTIVSVSAIIPVSVMMSVAIAWTRTLAGYVLASCSIITEGFIGLAGQTGPGIAIQPHRLAGTTHTWMVSRHDLPPAAWAIHGGCQSTPGQ